MSKSKAHSWTFGHSVFAPKASTQVPTQVICQIIKERRGRIGPKQGAGSIALGHIPSTTVSRDYPTRNRKRLQARGARSIATALGLSTQRSIARLGKRLKIRGTEISLGPAVLYGVAGTHLKRRPQEDCRPLGLAKVELSLSGPLYPS
jgi:hypothetical protein